MQPSPPPLPDLLQQARQARQGGRLDEERRLLDAAVARHPQDARVHNACGMAALADGDHDGALAAFEAATNLDPEHPALRINLATVHRARGDATAEEAALQGALDIDRADFIANLRLAELLMREGQLSRAAIHWSAVVQLANGMTDRPALVVDALRRGNTFLQEHNRDFALALERELGGKAVGLPESRRFEACVDVMLGRRRVYQNDCHGIHYPFLPADEFFDRAHFPWMSELEARMPEIRAEALALLQTKDSGSLRPYIRQDPGMPENKWSPLDQSLDWGASFLWEYGVRNDAVCAQCPNTAAALAAVPQSHLPGKAPTAFFSVLKGGAHIPPHTGVTNTRTIIHLPLVVPAGCAFRVGGETREWREGEAFAFDDTIEHEAWNRSDDERIVLIFDVWNPHLSDVEKELLTKLFAVADRGLVAEGR